MQTLGPTSCIVKECVSSIPPVQRSLLKLTTGNRVLDTLLVVVTAPVWVPATLAVVTAVLSIIASLWMFVAFLWLVVLAGFATGLLGVIFLVLGCSSGVVATGVYAGGVSFVVVGVMLLGLPVFTQLSTQIVCLTLRFIRWVAHFFMHGHELPAMPPVRSMHWPRPLLAMSAIFIVLGVTAALAVLATHSFDASTLAPLPTFQLFGQEFHPLVDGGGLGVGW